MEPVKNYFITMVMESKKYLECVGYYPTLETATKVVEENTADINETIYDYAMIEEIRMGLYADDIKRWWFEFDQETRRYIPCNTPTKFIYSPAYPEYPFPYSFK